VQILALEMTNNTQPSQSAQRCIQDRSTIYPGYNPGTLTHLPILGSSSILLPTEETQSLIKDLEQLQEDFFYEGKRV
jgi:hypothetical protein